MTANKKCLIVAPYWLLHSHLGAVRVERFVRWLSKIEVKVVVVCCGPEDKVSQREWGTEIAIKDPLGFYSFSKEDAPQITQMRKDNPLRRTIAYLLLVPDPIVLWARRAAKHPAVIEHAADSHWVLSSSPPESVHVAAEKIARGANAKLIVDLRDGWLDVPILPMLRNNPLQRWRHSRLESRILKRASAIFVTTDVWKELLTSRLPASQGKTTVLTNAYPKLELQKKEINRGKNSGELTLLYAGRIRSRTTRRENDLFEPLLDSLKSCNAHGRIRFLGGFSEPELQSFNEWRPRLAEIGWHIEVAPAVPRERAIEMMHVADGLILLSTTAAPIPAKFFEYLAARRPILAVTPTNGSVGRLEKSIPQLFIIDNKDMNLAPATMTAFLNYCLEGKKFVLPEEFSESTQMKRFLDTFALDHLSAQSV